MASPISDLRIDSLHRAFLTSLEWTIDRKRDGEIDDVPTAWVDLVASGLNDVRLTATPAIDTGAPPLPFLANHWIRTDVFTVARGGLRGGPRIDVLLQIWFDTEDIASGYGIPLIFHPLLKRGQMGDLEWHDLKHACHQITRATPSARVIFLSDEQRFEWTIEGFANNRFAIATDAQSLAGSRVPIEISRGRSLERFCEDLASGWIGDPALSGMQTSPVLDEVFCNFHVQHVLRIRIEREAGHDIWRPLPLPF